MIVSGRYCMVFNRGRRSGQYMRDDAGESALFSPARIMRPPIRSWNCCFHIANRQGLCHQACSCSLVDAEDNVVMLLSCVMRFRSLFRVLLLQDLINSEVCAWHIT